MMASKVSDHATNTRSSRYVVGKTLELTNGGRSRKPTHDEGTTLLLVGTRYIRHGLKDLYPGIIIDVNGIRIGVPANVNVSTIAGNATTTALHSAEGDINRCAAHFDGDDGVQQTDSSLKWF